jgi:hypothetical protein
VGDIAISQRKVSVAELRIYLSAPQWSAKEFEWMLNTERLIGDISGWKPPPCALVGTMIGSRYHRCVQKRERRQPLRWRLFTDGGGYDRTRYRYAPELCNPSL